MSRKFSLILILLVLVIFSYPAKAKENMAMPFSKGLGFIENAGQFSAQTRFKAQIGGNIYYFCSDKVACLILKRIISDYNPLYDNAGPLFRLTPAYSISKEGQIITSHFEGANSNIAIKGENRLPHRTNYFFGKDPSNWRTNVKSYSSIVYMELYPGISLKYSINGPNLKYEYTIAPGADLSHIKLIYEGPKNIIVDADGNLVLGTELGTLLEKEPKSYQLVNGHIRPIALSYTIQPDGTIGFKSLGEYDHTLPLIIDPDLVFSTYLGGTSDETALAMACDSAGNSYITGYTTSWDFPIENAYDSGFNGVWDIFVSKLSSSGDQLIYSTFLGGKDIEYAEGIVVDPEGRAIISGTTESATFPICNAFDSTYNGERDIVVAKLSANGDSLQFSTFIGGTGSDNAFNIALAPDTTIIVSGYTSSTDIPVPAAYDGQINGSSDAYLAHLSASGDSLINATYFGGSSSDYSDAIGLDSCGRLIIAGNTHSANFPVLNALDSTFNGGEHGGDMFLAKFNGIADSLLFSTYFGGSSNEQPAGLAIDQTGNIYIAGSTSSNDFPLQSAYDTHYHGRDVNGARNDGFVSKFTNACSLVYSTYLGGIQDDVPCGIKVDQHQNAFIQGNTMSPDFPIVDPIDGGFFDGIYSGGAYIGDAFLVELDSQGTEILYGTYIGGTGGDAGYASAMDQDGNPYISGYTWSRDFPLRYAFDDSIEGSGDIFALKFDRVLSAYDPIIPRSIDVLFSYPNPFNNETVISFELCKPGIIKLSIYNILGQRVGELLDGFGPAGTNRVVWDATGNPSGIYFARLVAADSTKIVKMTLLK
jgi:hypothetical protein